MQPCRLYLYNWNKVVLFWNSHTVGSLKIHWQRVKICTLAILFLATQVHSPPPPPSRSPSLITVSLLLSASHLSSLHHGRVVKILHTLTPPPSFPSTPSSRLFTVSHISPHFLLPPLTSALLASTSPSCFFFFSPSFAIFLSIYPSGIAIAPSFFLSLLLYWFTSQLSSSLPLTPSNRLSFFWSTQSPLSLSVSGMKDKDL